MSNAIKPIKIATFLSNKVMLVYHQILLIGWLLKNYFPKEIMNIYPLFLWHMFNAKVVTF